MIDRFLDMTDPTQSTVRAPSYNIEHRGWPKGRDEQSKSHMPSYGDASTAGSVTIQPNTTQGRGRRGRGSRVRNTH